MYCHSFPSEKVLHILPFPVVHQFKLYVEVTNFLLTRGDMKDRMPLAHTNCPRLQHIPEPILTEPPSRRRH